MNSTGTSRPGAAAGARGGHRPPAVLLYGALLAMSLFWSMNFIVGKFALREFPPVLLASLRTVLAALIMAPMYLWRRRNPVAMPNAEPPGMWTFVWLGLMGVTLNQLFFTVGLRRTSVAHSSLLIGMIPIFVLLLAAMRGLEKLKALRLIGMLVALGGVAVLNAAPSSGTPATLLGDFITICGTFCFAVFTVSGKRATCCVDSVTLTALIYGWGGAMLAPVALWQSMSFDYSTVSVGGWLGLLYMAAFPSVACYLIFYWALTQIPASRVASFSYLQPLTATMAAVPLLGEPVTVWLAAGGALVLLGVFLTERLK